MTYLLSVIIPVYNAENNIENGLNSIINQTMDFKNIEVVIIDDKSTDNTVNIVKNYVNNFSNIKLIQLNKNSGGPGFPRNMGISNASAPHIMFLDQDDYYLNDICQTLYEKITNEKVDFVSCLHYINSEKTIETAKIEINPLIKYGSEIKINNIKEFPIIYDIFNPHVIPIWNKIYKKSFLMKNNIKFPKKCLAEDFYFTLQCYLNGKFILLNNYIGYFYIQNLSSTSHTPSKENLDNLLCGYKMINKYLENKKYKIPKLFSNQMVYWTFLFLENELNYKNQKELLKKAKPLYNNFNNNNKIKSNYSSKIISLQNILIRIFSSNIYIGIILAKLYKTLRIYKLYHKIYYKNLKNAN